MCTGSGSFFKGIDCHWLKMDFQCNLTGSDIQIKEGSRSIGYPLFMLSISLLMNAIKVSFLIWRILYPCFLYCLVELFMMANDGVDSASHILGNMFIWNTRINHVCDENLPSGTQCNFGFDSQLSADFPKRTVCLF